MSLKIRKRITLRIYLSSHFNHSPTSFQCRRHFLEKLQCRKFLQMSKYYLNTDSTNNTVFKILRIHTAQWRRVSKDEEVNESDVGTRQIKMARLTIRPSYPKQTARTYWIGGWGRYIIHYVEYSSDKTKISYTIAGNQIPVIQSAANQIILLPLKRTHRYQSRVRYLHLGFKTILNITYRKTDFITMARVNPH